jgi:hypothetical protein
MTAAIVAFTSQFDWMVTAEHASIEAEKSARDAAWDTGAGLRDGSLVITGNLNPKH